MRCKNCGAELIDGAKFCGECGTVVEEVNRCPHCGAEIYKGATFCAECGKPINNNAVKCESGNAQDEAETVSETESANEINSKETKKDSGFTKKIIIIGAIIVVLAIILLLVFLPGQNDDKKQSVPETNATTSETMTTEDETNAAEVAEESGEVLGSNGQKYVQNGDVKTIKIISSGFCYRPDWDTCEVGFIMENISKEDYNNGQGIRITIKDKNGNILKSEELYNTAPLKKGEKTGRAEWYEVHSEPDIVEYQVINKSEGAWYSSEQINLTVDSVSATDPDEYGNADISGEVVNDAEKAFDYVAVHVLYKDKDNNIVGAAIAAAVPIEPVMS